MYASIDLVADKIERQLRKYKTRHSSQGWLSPLYRDDENTAMKQPTVNWKWTLKSAGTVAPEEVRPKIVRSKRFPSQADDRGGSLQAYGLART